MATRLSRREGLEQLTPTPPAVAEGVPPRPLRGRVSKFVIPEVIFGIGTLAEVGGAVRRVGGRRPMLVSDPGRARRRLGRPCGAPPRRRARAVAPVARPYARIPRTSRSRRRSRATVESGCDALLAIGGGSCIDLAKAVAILSGNGGQILDYEGIDRATSPIPPMVMVPTTGGSGSDVSQFCVVTDTRRRAQGDDRRSRARPRDLAHRPRAAHDDVRRSSPRTPGSMRSATRSSRCVSEACDFLSKGLAIAAIEGIVEHLPVAVEDPLDLTAREGMARASLQAGMAFTNALLGATHAIAHQIGGALDLPHGLLNAILHAARDALQRRDPRRPLRRRGRRARRRDRRSRRRTAAERAIERVEDLSRAPRDSERAAGSRRRSGRLRHCSRRTRCATPTSRPTQEP